MNNVIVCVYYRRMRGRRAIVRREKRGTMYVNVKRSIVGYWWEGGASGGLEAPVDGSLLEW